MQVKGLTNVKAIAAGAAHSLALKTDGTVWAWGWNALGELGYGATSASPHLVPVRVRGLTNVAAVAAGNGTSMALKSDGTVWVWGANFNALMGQPATTFFVATPTQVAGLSNVTQIFNGYQNMFAIKADGTLWAWGANSSGQLGTGTGDGAWHPQPVQVNVTEVVSVSSGFAFAHAVRADGSVWGWGSLVTGFAPHRIAAVAGAGEVASGVTHTAALLSNSTVRSWGPGEVGQLGDGGGVSRGNEWVEALALGRVATPTLSPEQGTFWPSVDVTVNCATPGAVIRFNVNSFNDVTENDPVLAAGTTLRFAADTRIRVKAWKAGMAPSATREANFSIFNSGSLPPLPNPIDNAFTFVGQQYRDFFGREADTAGLSFWANQITSCGTNATCVDGQRTNTSGAFFLSIEFQETGYLVYRYYRAAFGRAPRFNEFMADSRIVGQGVVVGEPNWQQKLEENKRLFADMWMLRADIDALYAG